MLVQPECSGHIGGISGLLSLSRALGEQILSLIPWVLSRSTDKFAAFWCRKAADEGGFVPVTGRVQAEPLRAHISHLGVKSQSMAPFGTPLELGFGSYSFLFTVPQHSKGEASGHALERQPRS